MYYDGIYDMTNENDDALSYGSTDNKKIKKMMAELASREDRGFFQITRQVPVVTTNNGVILKNKQIALYASGGPGTPIRNAVTGEYYIGHNVGSKYEYLYFKVGFHAGETGSKSKSKLGPETPNMFFSSPSEYEKHMLNSVKVDDNVSQKWREKADSMFM